MSDYNKTILKNGATVISHSVSFLNAAVVGVWIGTGSRHEAPSEYGYSHFLEHLLFKGTTTRSPKDIVWEIEKLGGELNAFTGREQTCFVATTLGQDVNKALEIIFDQIQNSVINPSSFKTEKTVAKSEIATVLDSPEEYVIEVAYEELFKNIKGLGHSILGTNKIITNATRNDLYEFYKSKYIPENIVVTIAGKINHNELCTLIEQLFEHNTPEHKAPLKKKNETQKTKQQQHIKIIKKKNELTYCVIGLTGPAFNSPNKYSMMLLNAILGDGMASRLFQNVREKYGEVYSIFSELTFFSDVSSLIVFFSSKKNTFIKTLQKVKKELFNITDNITDKEFDDFKNQIIGTIKIKSDSLEEKVEIMAKEHFYLEDKQFGLEKTAENVKLITKKDFITFVNALLNQQPVYVISGDINKKKTTLIEDLINGKHTNKNQKVRRK